MISGFNQGAPVVVGNWKMNGKGPLAKSEFAKMLAGFAELRGRVQAAVCPPATLIEGLAMRNDSDLIVLGAQNCVAEACGARTGDINAEMVSEAGAQIVILGHSERRALHGETSEMVREKVAAVWQCKLTALVCIGETREDRLSGKALDVVVRQLDTSLPLGANGDNLMIAYEPVWAIGTGVVPTCAELLEMHGVIKDYLGDRFDGAIIPLLYGGSVSSGNTAELMRTTPFDGLLVGKASLSAEEFLSIARICAELRTNSDTPNIHRSR